MLLAPASPSCNAGIGTPPSGVGTDGARQRWWTRIVIEELIGFDARLRSDLYLPLEWSAERRSSFLLEPAVEWPLSVDQWVWPSVFVDVAASRVRRDPLAHLQIAPDLSDYRQQAIGLWTSACAMKAAMAAADAMGRAVCIAIEVLTEKGLERDPDWRDRLGGIAPPVPAGVNWYRAGFDVADIGYVSGLSNCGWIAEEEVPLKRRWAPLLNEHGLFSDLGVALDFRAEMDERAPEHAPFFVYRIALCEWADIA